MSQQIIDPLLPDIGPIDRRQFSPGRSIVIQGVAPSTAHRFCISLLCGPTMTPQTDIALQIAVHLLDGYIILNSFKNGSWGEEQRGTIPIKRSKQFEIAITSDLIRYKVIIDGRIYAEFPQRILYMEITHLAISGDVSILKISYEAAIRGLSELSRPSAPVPLSENEEIDFEEVTIGETAPIAATYPQSFTDSSAPPSYEAAIESSTRAPYPTGDPMGMPLIPNREGRDFLPYPPSVQPRMQPRSIRTMGIHAPPIQPLVIPPPPRDAPVPLNIGESNSQPVRSSPDDAGSARCVIGVILAIIAVVAFIIKLSSKTRR